MLQAVDIDSDIRWVPGDVVLWQGTVQYTFRGKVIDAENELLLYRRVLSVARDHTNVSDNAMITVEKLKGKKNSKPLRGGAADYYPAGERGIETVQACELTSVFEEEGDFRIVKGAVVGRGRSNLIIRMNARKVAAAKGLKVPGKKKSAPKKKTKVAMQVAKPRAVQGNKRKRETDKKQTNKQAGGGTKEETKEVGL